MNSKPYLQILLLAVAHLGMVASGVGQSITSDSLTAGNNYRVAAFRLWLPSNEKVRGIIVMMPGSNGDGRNLILDTAWQRLAAKHRFALVGCYFTDNKHDNMDIERYADVKYGSGSALITALRNLSVRTTHPELATAPLALWGMSAGGEFNYEFACWKPERVISFIVNKGGIYYSALTPAAAWEVPGLFITGERDSPYRNEIINGIFAINRRFGARWIYVSEPGVAHEFDNSARFARFYFDQLVPIRVTAEGTLMSLPSSGFIATRHGEIEAEGTNRPAEITSWFPSRAIAEGWMRFVR